MKGAASLSFVTLAFVAVSGVVSAPTAMERNSPIADVIERQSGVTCSADAAITVTDATPLNETSAIEKRQSPLPGYCTTNNQICQLRWSSGNFVCQGYCHCSIASPCYYDDNYCFYNSGTSQCICDT